VPGGYAERLVSIVDHSRDSMGSAPQRQNLLLLSIKVALLNPLFGVGMGNFVIVSIRGLVTHNAYTQVAAEMGLPALVVFWLFLYSPYKRLRQIERETFDVRAQSRFYYLAVGIQASLAGFMVNLFFISSAYQWYTFYLVGYAICLRRVYQISKGSNEDTALEATKRKRERGTAGSLSSEGEPAHAQLQASAKSRGRQDVFIQAG
jgi:O-antigen ligase